MASIRFGQVDYLNCLPVYHALEENVLPFEGELVKGPPTMLNKMLFSGDLDVTALSSVEYARHIDQSFILPNLSVSANGPVHSIFLFSHVPVTELDGKKICLTSSSATSVALLKVLFDHYYHVDAEFVTVPPDLEKMMSQADGAMLIGDDAMRANLKVKEENLPYHVTDLGEVWKQFTGEPMVYALWVVRKDFALQNPELIDKLCKVLSEAKVYSGANMDGLLKKCRRRSGLPVEVLEEYFKTISNEFGDEQRKALLTFFDYCYKSGLIDERVRLSIWGEEVV